MSIKSSPDELDEVSRANNLKIKHLFIALAYENKLENAQSLNAKLHSSFLEKNVFESVNRFLKQCNFKPISDPRYFYNKLWLIDNHKKAGLPDERTRHLLMYLEYKERIRWAIQAQKKPNRETLQKWLGAILAHPSYSSLTDLVNYNFETSKLSSLEGLLDESLSFEPSFVGTTTHQHKLYKIM